MHPCLSPIQGENAPFESAVVIPGIASIEVTNLGSISHAEMAFPDRVTLINTARPPRVLGATTLVLALAAAGGCRLPSGLLDSSTDTQSRIIVKWRNSPMLIEPVFPRSDSEPTFGGERMVLQLANAIHQTGRDQCIVLDHEVFGMLDRRLLDEAFNLIEASRCQIIAFLPSIELTIIPTSLRKSVCYALIEDPTEPGRSTLIPFSIDEKQERR